MLWFQGMANPRPQMTVDAADNAEGWRFFRSGETSALGRTIRQDLLLGPAGSGA